MQKVRASIFISSLATLIAEAHNLRYSAMTIGTHSHRQLPFCESVISYPLSVRMSLTYFDEKLSTSITWIARTVVTGGGNTTFSNMTIVSTGIALAQPIIIAWNLDDMSVFPSDYAKSLAQRIGISVSTSASPAGTSALPSNTGAGMPVDQQAHSPMSL